MPYCNRKREGLSSMLAYLAVKTVYREIPDVPRSKSSNCSNCSQLFAELFAGFRPAAIGPEANCSQIRSTRRTFENARHPLRTCEQLREESLFSIIYNELGQPNCSQTLREQLRTIGNNSQAFKRKVAELNQVENNFQPLPALIFLGRHPTQRTNAWGLYASVNGLPLSGNPKPQLCTTRPAKGHAGALTRHHRTPTTTCRFSHQQHRRQQP